MTPAINQEKPAILISVISIGNTVYMLPFKDVSLPCGYGWCFSVYGNKLRGGWCQKAPHHSMIKGVYWSYQQLASLSWLFIFHSSVENPFSLTNSWNPPKKKCWSFLHYRSMFPDFFLGQATSSISRVLCAAIFPGAGNFHPWNESPWHPPKLITFNPPWSSGGSPLAFLHRILPPKMLKPHGCSK